MRLSLTAQTPTYDRDRRVDELHRAATGLATGHLPAASRLDPRCRCRGRRNDQTTRAAPTSSSRAAHPEEQRHVADDVRSDVVADPLMHGLPRLSTQAEVRRSAYQALIEAPVGSRTPCLQMPWAECRCQSRATREPARGSPGH